MRSAGLALLATALVAQLGGCAFVFDMTFDKESHKRRARSTPTGEIKQGLEFEGAVAKALPRQPVPSSAVDVAPPTDVASPPPPYGAAPVAAALPAVDIACFDRDRSLDRTWTEYLTYDEDYGATIAGGFIDGVGATALLIATGVGCARDTSCYWMLTAAPFVAGVMFAVYRAATTDKVLVDKSRSGAGVASGEVTRQVELDCSRVLAVDLMAGGNTLSNLVREDARRWGLPLEGAAAWLQQPQAVLKVVTESATHDLAVPMCALLKGHSYKLPYPASGQYSDRCIPKNDSGHR